MTSFGFGMFHRWRTSQDHGGDQDAGRESCKDIREYEITSKGIVFWANASQTIRDSSAEFLCTRTDLTKEEPLDHPPSYSALSVMQAVSGHNLTPSSAILARSRCRRIACFKRKQRSTKLRPPNLCPMGAERRRSEMLRNAGTRCRSTASTELLLEHFLDLPNLFLDFAEVVFGFAFGL